MGIFHRGSGDLTITGQAIGRDAGTSGRDAARERNDSRKDSRADRARDRDNDGAAVHTGVSNTGTGSIKITNSTVNGEHIARRTIR